MAEYLYPNRILSAIYDKGKELIDIAIKGTQLRQSELNQAVEDKFEGHKRIYQEYSLYVHTSAKHHLKCINDLADDNETKAIRRARRTIKRSPAKSDMILLNQYMEDVMLEVYQRLITTLKVDKTKLKQYKEWEQFSFIIEE